MTVHQYFIFSLFAALNNYMMHNLHYLNGYLMLWCLQIFPIKVKVLNSIVHQQLRSITKPNLGNDAISAVRMLTWFLEVKNSCDSLLFKLSNDIVFLYQSIAQPLGAD
jgi:hypothetical protein